MSEMKEGLIYKKVYREIRLPEEGFVWYDTNKGVKYFDGENFYNSGVCVNPVDEEIVWWAEQITEITDEEIEEMFVTKNFPRDGSTYLTKMKIGARAMRDKIFK